MKTLHLFAGAGGGMLADLILGHTPIGAVEIDPYCCALLRERSDDGWFPGLRVHECDIRAFDASEYAGRVDIVHAGIPCPRWSSARAGRGEPLDYWPEAYRVVGRIKPRYAFLENVVGFLERHAAVSRDLERIGYRVSAPLITDAAGVGAPYSRARYWCLARSDGIGEPMGAVNDKTPVMQPVAGAISPWSRPPHLGVADGAPGRMDRFAAAGNAQVPIQAALAWQILMGRIT